MALKDIVVASRSYRRFHQDKPVAPELLDSILDTVRLAPTSSNLQPFRYAYSTSPEVNARIFPNTAWAGALKDWPGPEEGERPAAYIILAGDLAQPKFIQSDKGIPAQTICLLLAEAGLGACMLGSINAKALHEIFELPDGFAVVLAIAIGYPKEDIVLDDVGPDGSTTYWREPNGRHHVPKRRLEDVVVRKFV